MTQHYDTLVLYVALAVAMWYGMVPPLGAFDVAPCTGEAADVCGFLPSLYANLSLVGVPPLCDAECPPDFMAVPEALGGWDRCGVCGGPATFNPQVLLEPTSPPEDTYIGGSVAAWNGTVAASQHIAQYAIDIQYTAVVPAPVTTWNRNPVTGAYTEYQIPWRIGDAVDELTYLPVGRGYALIMDGDHLVIGSHDTEPRELQLWTRTPNAMVPWQFAWRTVEFCPGAHFGYDVAIDPTPPREPDQAMTRNIVAGDPSAHISGAASVYFTDSPLIVQIIYFEDNPESTEVVCFGQSVSADSGWLAIGAPAYEYSSTVHSGSVFVYKWNPLLNETGQYEFVLQIVPPTPEVNGGFGVDVSFSQNELTIGDNQHTVYKYLMVGLVAVPIGIDQPIGLSGISRFGYTISLWRDFFAAGDNTYVVSPTQQGSTFVWDRNPLNLAVHRGPRYQFYDEMLGNFNTFYGTAVDLRGGNGCFLASGTIAEDTAGGVWVVDMCRDDCYGCDNVLNSCAMPDECGVCAGDNSTCIDCFGVLNGPAELDGCGVCNGDNSTCVSPIAAPPAILTPCEQQVNVTLTYPYGNQHGPANWTVVGAPTTGSVQLVPIDNVDTLLIFTPFPYESGIDQIDLFVEVPTTGANDTLSIPIIVGACLDCYDVLNGPARPDECGVCEGDNSTCAGCDGVPNSGLELDYCGVCGGDNSTCVDILLEPFYAVPCYSQIIFQLQHEPADTPVDWEIVENPVQGTVHLNEESGYVIYMNPVVMGEDYFKVMITSLLNSSVTDMQNVTLHIMDCMDCDNNTLGIQILDACGICNGDNTVCAGCDGIPNSGVGLDLCGVCGGNDACVDCFGLPFGNGTLALDAPDGMEICCSLVVDLCGVCGGDNDCARGKGVVPTVFLFGGFVFILLMLFLCGFHNWFHFGHWYWHERIRNRRTINDIDGELRDAYNPYAPSYGDEQQREDAATAELRAQWRARNEVDQGWGNWDTLQEADQSAQNARKRRAQMTGTNGTLADDKSIFLDIDGT